MHTSSTAQPRYYGKVAKLGLVWGMLRVGTNTLLLMPTSIVLARLLTPTEFGVSAAAAFFLSLSSRLTQFGFGTALVRVKTLRPEHASSVFVVNLALGASAWLTLTIAAPYLGAFLHSADTARVLPTAGLGFVLVGAGSVPTALLARDMRWRESAFSDWLGTVLNSVIAITLAWKGFSYWSLVYGQLANQTAMTVTRMWMVRWRPTLRFSRSAVHEIASFGTGIYVKNLLDYAVQNLDNLIVGRLLGVTALGFYDKAFNFTSKLIANINLAGPSVSFRVFALIHEEQERFRRAYRKVVLTVTLVGYPILTAMIVVAPSLVEVLFGRRWLPAVLPFRILCAAAMLKLLNTYASTATQAKGMIWSEVQRQAGFVAILVVAVAALCRFGIGGAAAGVLVATLGMTVLMQTLVKRLTGLRWADMIVPQLPAVLCAALIAAALVFTEATVRAWAPAAQPMVLLASAVAVATCCHLGFVLLVPIAAVREAVGETLHDLAPSLAGRVPSLIAAKKAPAYSAQ